METNIIDFYMTFKAQVGDSKLDTLEKFLELYVIPERRKYLREVIVVKDRKE